MAARIVLILRWIAIAAIVVAILLIIVRRKIPPRRIESQSMLDWCRELWHRWQDKREDARDHAANLAALRGKKALVIDPDEKSARILAWRLQKLRCSIIKARHGAKGLAMAREDCPDFIVADALLPDMTAPEFYHSLPVRELPIVFVGVPTGQWDELRSLSRNVVCLSKPFDPEDVASLAGMILRRLQA